MPELKTGDVIHVRPIGASDVQATFIGPDPENQLRVLGRLLTPYLSMVFGDGQVGELLSFYRSNIYAVNGINVHKDKPQDG